MKIKDEQFFRTIRSFFEIYLVKNRSCSPNTVKSYKDALNLYLDFLEAEKASPQQRRIGIALTGNLCRNS